MKKNTIKVWPVEGRSLPREDAPQRLVKEAFEAPNTAYYRRALERGDLTDRDPKKAAPTPKEG